jgi:hypothetical protein
MQVVYDAIVGLNQKYIMKIGRKFWVPLLSALIFTSCAKIIYIGKKIDPEIVLSKQHHSIVFVNIFDYTSPANINESGNIVYHDGIMGLMDGLSSIADDSTFSFTVADTLKKGIGSGLLTTLLPIDTINSICIKNKSDMLLSLDSMSVFLDSKFSTDIDEYGNNHETKDFFLNTEFYLSLYSHDGELINRSEVSQSYLYGSRPANSYSGAVKLSLSAARQDVASQGFQSGQDYTAKFYPQISQDVKQLYTGQQFRESNNLIFAKNFEKAIELLYELAKSPDKIIAAKAKHNLEVAKEAFEAGRK